MRACQTYDIKYPVKRAANYKEFNRGTHIGCKKIQAITGREHAMPVEFCEVCLQREDFLIWKVVLTHARGLARRVPNIDLQSLVHNLKQTVSPDFAREVLLEAADGGHHETAELVAIAKEEGLDK